MRPGTKRRREHRYRLMEPIPVRLMVRNLREGRRGVKGLLYDVSNGGIGVLVQEHVALETRCTVEVNYMEKRGEFRGEVCYATRTLEGIRLGILVNQSGTKTALAALRELGVMVD